MAAELSEPDKNWSVLALDRGSPRNSAQNDTWDEDLSSVHDPNYFSAAQDYLLGRLVRNPRYYSTGETVMINGMIAVAPYHYCYYLPLSLTGISEEDCLMWHGQDGSVDVAPPLFNHLA
ncbi:unnamed protein product [Rotaria sp. Silwood2]|nr:unnamed protein product [Rotaria sp. Silwood2]